MAEIWTVKLADDCRHVEIAGFLDRARQHGFTEIPEMFRLAKYAGYPSEKVAEVISKILRQK